MDEFGGIETEVEAGYDEDTFQQWYKGWANKAGIDLNPDNPLHKYDYRAAFKAGAYPKISPKDDKYHWPSETRRVLFFSQSG